MADSLGVKVEADRMIQNALDLLDLQDKALEYGIDAARRNQRPGRTGFIPMPTVGDIRHYADEFSSRAQSSKPWCRACGFTGWTTELRSHVAKGGETVMLHWAIPCECRQAYMASRGA